jgi:NAD(P)-dependent dehydrogenase (short-subunit alcohol dehydrogenase family)
MGGYQRYGTAKLASMVFSSELARRVPGVRSNSVHPGVVATNMLQLANFEAMLGPAFGAAAFHAAKLRNSLLAFSPEAAAVNVLHCAVSPTMENVSGALFVPLAIRWQPRHSMVDDEQFGRALWEFSTSVVEEALQR